MNARQFAFLILAGVGSAVLHAQIPQPDDAPKPLTPEQSAAAFQLPEGFRMEVVACEPLIAAPSAVCWDERGRMFVSELHGYNLEGQLDIEELNKSGKLDTQVRRVQADEKFKRAAQAGTYGVVKLLLDTNGDGRMDKAVVWATNLPPAYGLVAARGGVIVASAPDIVFLADRDGDGVAETREVLFTGFRTGALERGINAPLWNVDGWIYFGRGHGAGTITGPRLASPTRLPDSDFRIRADGSAIEPVTGGTHTLGFAFTEAGDRFVSTTYVPGVFIAPLPSHYLARNPDAATPSVSVPTGDRHAYQISKPHPWRQKRAEDAAYAKFYRDRYGAGDSEAGGWFTSACGAFVYQDNVLPGLHGQYFVCEPSGNIIHRSRIEPDGSALKLVRVPGEERAEFAASRDGWSHPIRLQHGPDGRLWVVDFYREIIEDYSAIPRHLQQQYGLYAGHDRGRIYRLTHRDAPTSPSADMAALSAEMLAKEISSQLFWRRETAQRLLVERRASPGTKERGAAEPGDARRSEESAVAVLRGLLADSTSTVSTLISALHTLDQLGALPPAELVKLLTHRDPAVRIHALRLGEQWLAKDTTLINATLAAAASETNPRVALQFAFSLGEARDPRAFAMLARYARERLDIHWMDAALLSSLHGRGGEMLAELLREPVAAAPFLDQLAGTIAARRDSAELARTLGTLSQTTPERQAALLTSLARGRANAKRQPLDDPAASRALATLAASAAPDVRRAARSLEETFVPAPPDDEAIAGLPVPGPAVSEETFRRYVAALSGARDARRGHELFLSSCATCHRVGDEGTHFGPDLMGELGMAEETLVRHLLLPSERIRPGFETALIETQAGTSFAGLLIEDGATSLTLRQPGGVEKVVLRQDVRGVRRSSVSLMPSFAEALPPADVASVLAWLRAQLKAGPPGRAMLFDEEAGFAALLHEGGGHAEVVPTRPFSGALCLSVTPPQRYSARIPGWSHQIVERPSATNEFRYLRLAWRATGDGVMLELAADGQWPKATDPRRRYFSGRNTTEWKAREVSATVPSAWREEVFDLWKDCGAFTLTGLAPTAMGGPVFFDRLELMQEQVVKRAALEAPPGFRIQLDTLSRGYDGQTCWVHPRAGAIPGATPSVVLTMQKLMLTGSDVFFALNEVRSDDLGKTWRGPAEHAATLGRRNESNDVIVAACDFWPKWHAKSGRLLGIGHTVRYRNERKIAGPRETVWSVYDPERRAWTPWAALAMPEEAKFSRAGAGCVQRVDLPDGDILLPIYFQPEGAKTSRITVLRCAFDGRNLTCRSHGNELALEDGRGLHEPSLTPFNGRYYLTIRNDNAGYVTTSPDGLNFDPPQKWRWDDGTDLGNYNTQQHWVTHSEGLFLVYTRKGASNDHVFRHRAPLFIAQVDPVKLQVIRRTERVLVPERGARLGNFGVTEVNERETWVTVAEWMQSWPPNVVIPPGNPRGADNSVYAARILWERPNGDWDKR